ncbi:hypothetical protein QQ054_06035 [Oscillatoria amoena NRMC-F 0135]|nr:hypothetical protein [Geitlerinema splendidum]MDL5045596.1 hypothetical protein [Oscillatoria amoena NRMC-F 0135]
MKAKYIACKIAKLLENLPSDQIRTQAITEDQKQEWSAARKHNELISKGWKDSFSKNSDSVARYLENKEIDKLQYEYITSKVRYYRMIWSLVKELTSEVNGVFLMLLFCRKMGDFLEYKDRSFLEFKKYFDRITDKYSYWESPLELFAEIIRQEEDDTYKWCLEPYVDISLTKAAKGVDLIQDWLLNTTEDEGYYQPSPTEWSNLKSCFWWQSKSASWLVILLITSQIYGDKNLKIRKKVFELNQLILELSGFAKTAIRKRNSPTWKKRTSVIWHNGKKKIARPVA